jgi:hypothetical protein
MISLHIIILKKNEKTIAHIKSLLFSNFLTIATCPLNTSIIKKVNKKVPKNNPKKLTARGTFASGFNSSSFFSNIYSLLIGSSYK